MKIIHIIIGLNVGGAELMLKRLIESHSHNSNYQHTVVSLTTIGVVGRQLQVLGVEVSALGMCSLLGIPCVLWRLVQLIRSSGSDIIQTWMYHADFLGGLAARLAGNRHVVWGVRTTDVAAGGSRLTLALRQVCARLSYWVPHTIVCAAEAARQRHVAAGYDSTRMVVVANGIDFSRLSATVEQKAARRRLWGFGVDAVLIGSLARFNPVKDQATFVRAAGLLTHRNPHVRFIMIGRGLDADNTQLAQWIAATGHADRFLLLGERDDVSICLGALDIFCLHSRTEAFPNVLGEAMAMGLPCVATDVGDAAVLLADTGVIVPKQDPITLAQGLEQVLAMGLEARQEMGRKAKARVLAEFTMERARERFEAVYRRVLTEPPPTRV